MVASLGRAKAVAAPTITPARNGFDDGDGVISVSFYRADVNPHLFYVVLVDAENTLRNA